MRTIEDFFEFYKNKPGDINEHFDTLKKYSLECSHITEMGVRNVVSTWAFLAANPKKYIGIDFLPCPYELAGFLAKERGIDFTFIQGDTIDPNFDIEPTELLFIDTNHIYRQLIKELRKYNEKVTKYIIMHDTTCFGYVDQERWDEYSTLVGEPIEKQGLWTAIEEFLGENPKWELLERFTHNNGLTILHRK